jgi:hypothetical protein
MTLRFQPRRWKRSCDRRFPKLGYEFLGVGKAQQVARPEDFKTKPGPVSYRVAISIGKVAQDIAGALFRFLNLFRAVRAGQDRRMLGRSRRGTAGRQTLDQHVVIRVTEIRHRVSARGRADILGRFDHPLRRYSAFIIVCK